MAEKDKVVKKRNWGGVVYPESAPEDWREQLTIKGIAWACSPLHDSDLNPTGEPKKEHYHIILSFPGPTTYNVVETIMEELNQPIPIALESVRGAYRYFTHMDNPDKHQYDSKDIKLYNGFDITDVLNNFDVMKCLRKIQKYIMDNNITEYSTLCDIFYCTDQIEMLSVATSKTMFLEAYIRSKRNRLKSSALKSIDKEFDINKEVNIIETSGTPDDDVSVNILEEPFL